MTIPQSLNLVSYLAPNGFWFYKAIAAYLQESLEIEVCITAQLRDPLADPTILNNGIDLAFMCGLPFIRYQQRAPTQFQPLVAPVMQAHRYLDRPVYFSDVIVRGSSRFKTFSDLYSQTFCYNDTGSNSGYHLLCYDLLQKDYPRPFFKTAFQSGSHQQSIQAVIAGQADCAAIDSTVLEQALRDTSNLSHQLQVIESIGPCPMPPLIGAQRLGAPIIRRIQSALLNPTAPLQAVMRQAGIRRYEVVDVDQYSILAAYYEAVRKIGSDSILATASR